MHINEQLPTPPDEPLTLVTVSSSRKQDLSSQVKPNWPSTGRWPTPQSESSSISTSPPPLDEPDSELPSFADSQFDEVLQGSLDPLVLSTNRFDFGRTSPTSSNEVEIDSDDERGGLAETDSRRASSREAMHGDTQDGMDPWNT